MATARLRFGMSALPNGVAVAREAVAQSNRLATALVLSVRVVCVFSLSWGHRQRGHSILVCIICNGDPYRYRGDMVYRVVYGCSFAALPRRRAFCSSGRPKTVVEPTLVEHRHWFSAADGVLCGSHTMVTLSLVGNSAGWHGKRIGCVGLKSLTG